MDHGNNLNERFNFGCSTKSDHYYSFCEEGIYSEFQLTILFFATAIFATYKLANMESDFSSFAKTLQICTGFTLLFSNDFIYYSIVPDNNIFHLLLDSFLLAALLYIFVSKKKLHEVKSTHQYQYKFMITEKSFILNKKSVTYYQKIKLPCSIVLLLLWSNLFLSSPLTMRKYRNHVQQIKGTYCVCLQPVLQFRIILSRTVLHRSQCLVDLL